MFQTEIHDADDNKLGPGPIISGTKWTYRQKLSQAGDWTNEVPLAEPRLDYALLKRRIHCYLRKPTRTVWFGGGIIQKRGYSLSGTSPSMMNLSGPDLLRELAGVTVNFEVSAATPAPRATAILEAIASAVPDWTITIPSGLPEITARFVHESALNALVSTCEKLGCFFWMEPYTVGPRKIVISKTPLDSEIVATNLADPIAAERNLNICLLSDIEREETAWDAKNRLIVYGAGDGQARLTLASATLWPDGITGVASPYAYTDPMGVAHNFVLDKATNTITDTLAVAAYGQDEAAVAFKEIAPITQNDADFIAAANTLVSAAVNQLVLSSFPQVNYRLTVAALRGVVHPGMTIQVHARKVRDGVAYINLSETLVILEVGYEVDTDGEKVNELVVSTSWKPEKTGATILSEAIQKLTAMDAHPQEGANENTFCYREDVDDDYSAGFPFWMSRGTSKLWSVTLRYKLEKLRSTVKASGTASTSTGSGGGATPTSSTYAPVVNHSHQVDVVNSAPSGSPVYYSASFGLNASGGGTLTPTTLTTLPLNHSHTVTVPAHTHTLTPTITNSYGVYEDPGTAYTVTDLDWTINTIPITETPTSIGSGWYEVDITHYMTDATTLRPLAYANAVEVAVKTASHAAKKVRVTAQIELRTTIQTIAAV
jgi:hypothetical protein